MQQKEAIEYVASQIDSYETAEALIEWFNRARPTKDELDDLVKLEKNGQFHLWVCDLCGETVRQGHPYNWNNFQGVCQDEGGPVEINGREKMICGYCYSHNPIFF